MSTTWTGRTLSLANGTELFFLDSGSRSGTVQPARTIVLLHGYCGSSSYFEQLMPLLDSSLRVIAPDLRGHGRSSASSVDKYRMEDFAEDVAQLLEQLGTGPVLLLGHSLGGYVTLAFAEQYPDRLDGFGLIHSTPLPDSDEAKAGRDKAVATLEAQGTRAFVDALVPRLFAPSVAANNPELIQRTREIGYETDNHGAMATARGMKDRPDRRHVLEQTSLPVLLVAGSRDAVVPPEKTFAVERDTIITHLIEGSGHMGMIENPQALAAIIQQF